jgi:hypothetical protein
MTVRNRTNTATPVNYEDWAPELDTLAGTTGVTLLGFVTVEEPNPADY